MVASYPDRLELALTAADIERSVKRGRLASLLGMEGGHAIENSLGVLRAYYALGARYMTRGRYNRRIVTRRAFAGG